MHLYLPIGCSGLDARLLPKGEHALLLYGIEGYEFLALTCDLLLPKSLPVNLSLNDVSQSLKRTGFSLNLILLLSAIICAFWKFEIQASFDLNSQIVENKFLFISIFVHTTY